jgi:hypothetical protein
MLAFMSKQDDKYTEAYEELCLVDLNPLRIALAQKPKLKWDIDNGEGFIENLESFRQDLDPFLRLNLLENWSDLLDEERDRALKEWATWREKSLFMIGCGQN